MASLSDLRSQFKYAPRPFDPAKFPNRILIEEVGYYAGIISRFSDPKWFEKVEKVSQRTGQSYTKHEFLNGQRPETDKEGRVLPQFTQRMNVYATIDGFLNRDKKPLELAWEVSTADDERSHFVILIAKLKKITTKAATSFDYKQIRGMAVLVETKNVTFKGEDGASETITEAKRFHAPLVVLSPKTSGAAEIATSTADETQLEDADDALDKYAEQNL